MIWEHSSRACERGAISLWRDYRSAQAGHRGWAIGAAVLGAAVVGATVANSAPYDGYYAVEGYRRCGWERQYDRYGFYVGTVKVCRVY